MGDGGTSLASAESQAEGELVTALGIGGSGFQPGGVGINLNELGSDNDQNAYLFAMSAVLVQAAQEQAGEAGSVDAQLQELMNTIASDLANGGSIPASVISEIRTAEQDLDVDLTMDLFASRLQALGSTAAPADLNRAIDTDGDGYRNSIDTCPLVANPDQSKIPSGAVCKTTRYISTLPPLTAGGNSFSSVLADLEHVGRAQILLSGLSGSTSPTAALLSGDGSGRFPQAVAVQLPPGWTPTTSFDVNQDGNLDLVDPNGWSAGDGAGHFGSLLSFPGFSFPGPVLTGVPGQFALADFNGDGLTDVARVSNWTEYGESVISVSLGTAKGVFGPSVERSVLVPLSQAVTGDGSLIPASEGGVGVFLPGGAWQALPDASFDSSVVDLSPDGSVGTGTWPAWYASASYVSVFAGDVNNDHRVDLVEVWNAGASAFQVLLGDGSGGFKAMSLVLIPYTSWAALADCDGDGNLDIVLSGGDVHVVFGDGTGVFGPLSTTVLSQNGQATFGDPVMIVDLNADGKADLVFFETPPANYPVDLVFLGSQGRKFAPPQILRTRPIDSGLLDSNPQPSVLAGDVNADGAPDLVVLSANSSGAFSAQAILMNVLR